MSRRRIGILGAGPIGIETAVYALEQGFEVDVYEQTSPGAHVGRWSHVDFFSPWSMNRSEWGQRALRQAGHRLADQDTRPSGRQYLDEYLLPLARGGQLDGCIHQDTRVDGVARRDALKGDFIGDDRRAQGPFVIRVTAADGPRDVHADIVIDTTGVYGQPAHLGRGGLPAVGEQSAEALIERYIPDVHGADRPTYEDKSILLVGGGYSAVTSARLLAELHQETPQTRVNWLLRGDRPPYTTDPDDPLAERLALATFGNDAAGGNIDGLEVSFGQLAALDGHGDGLRAHVDTSEGLETLEIDRVIGNVGYKPDVSLYRELQVHQCYATEGLMNLSAYLLGQDGGGDCLDQTSGGFDTLVSPEPDFYVLGSKSYGRNSDFLLRVGFEQIEELFDEL